MKGHTAVVALAGILAALRLTEQKIAEQRFLFLGAGSAATGIAGLISLAMVREGMDLAAAQRRNALFDSKGLLVSSRTDLTDFQEPFAQDRADERPIVFPYSNPTSRSECTAEETYRWSDGRAVFASGSPFPPVEIAGRRLVPGQGNNVYVFPAIGMAVFATEATRVTEEMFIVARQAIAEQVSEDDLSMGLIYPPQSHILDASLNVAERVATYIFDQGLARVPRPDDVGALIRARTENAICLRAADILGSRRSDRNLGHSGPPADRLHRRGPGSPRGQHASSAGHRWQGSRADFRVCLSDQRRSMQLAGDAKPLRRKYSVRPFRCRSEENCRAGRTSPATEGRHHCIAALGTQLGL